MFKKTDKHAKNDLANAAITASGQLMMEGVAHCLVGRLGLSMHGFAESSKRTNVIMVEDVEFLVDPTTAFSDGGDGLVLTRRGLPLAVDDIKVKWCSLDDEWELKLWSQELIVPRQEGSVPIASLPVILCLMMMAGDEEAVAAAVSNGAPATGAHSILEEHSPRLGSRLAAMIEAVQR
jgi:hypothetical protein